MPSHLKITLYLDGSGVQGDDQVEALPSPRSADKPEVSELGHALHHVGLVVTQLRPVVLVVSGGQAHQSPGSSMSLSRTTLTPLKMMKHLDTNHHTLKTTGRDLFDLKCVGRTLQRMSGLPVLISSARDPAASPPSATHPGRRTAWRSSPPGPLPGSAWRTWRTVSRAALTIDSFVKSFVICHFLLLLRTQLRQYF